MTRDVMNAVTQKHELHAKKTAALEERRLKLVEWLESAGPNFEKAEAKELQEFQRKKTARLEVFTKEKLRAEQELEEVRKEIDKWDSQLVEVRQKADDTLAMANSLMPGLVPGTARMPPPEAMAAYLQQHESQFDSANVTKDQVAQIVVLLSKMHMQQPAAEAKDKETARSQTVRSPPCRLQRVGATGLHRSTVGW